MPNKKKKKSKASGEAGQSNQTEAAPKPTKDEDLGQASQAPTAEAPKPVENKDEDLASLCAHGGFWVGAEL